MNSVPRSPRLDCASPPFRCEHCGNPLTIFEAELYCPQCTSFRPTYATTDRVEDWLNDLLASMYGPDDEE